MADDYSLEIVNPQALKATADSIRQWTDPQLTHELAAAAKAGAKAMVRPLQAAAPVKSRGGASAVGKNGKLSGKGGYGKAGDMRRSIKAIYDGRGGKSGGVAYIVGPMGSRAFMRYWVTGGTKAHDIPVPARTPTGGKYKRILHNKGARANPFVDRVGNQYRAVMAKAMYDELVKAAK